MSALYDNFASITGGGVTTLTTPSFAITSAPTRAAALGLILNTSATGGFTSSCGGVAGAVVADSGLSPGGPGSIEALVHVVLQPPSGTQTATMSWTNAGGCAMGVMTASNVGAANNGTIRSQVGVTTASITVPTKPGDLTFALGMTDGTLSAPTQTNLLLDAGSGAGWSRGGGLVSSDIHQWTNAPSSNVQLAGCNLVAAGPDVYPDLRLFPKPIMQPAAPFPENS